METSNSLLSDKKVKVFLKEECESVWKEERGIEQQLESKRCVTWNSWNPGSVEDQDDWIHLLLLLSQPSTGGDGDETYDGN